MKKIATMQDISCIGKCSLTVALPIISSMGIETAVLPTAVLSTHTMFQGFTFHDLTSEIHPILSHWEKEKFQFSALYTGYLGSQEQISIAKHLFEKFKGTGITLVDPCMADNGKLYPGFDMKFAKEMASLCQVADIICPNLTEASYLLDIPYCDQPYDEAYIQFLLKQLTDLGAKTAVLTGISFEPGKIGAYAYNKAQDTFYSYFTDEQPERFHGTGDIWASSFLGALMNEKEFETSLKIACDFVSKAIQKTLAEPNHSTYGVNFEQAIPSLIESLH